MYENSLKMAHLTSDINPGLCMTFIKHYSSMYNCISLIEFLITQMPLKDNLGRSLEEELSSH